jgi:hypothetical protein
VYLHELGDDDDEQGWHIFQLKSVVSHVWDGDKKATRAAHLVAHTRHVDGRWYVGVLCCVYNVVIN